ncbi:2-iminoacetate synthase ThiH [Pontibacillus litoralis]|uniref:Thiamine biosynthesis protein ThiH n=1 Tax=Pontibacillus litoralis JSM 072002 TaxID=1385512 RepID=A0A0A5HN19_9BACI|nr:2-iminoacetate synthase ThiH [Pontibacillus litoralis]KGX84987.1 thiamine biosynthesis protein ThiH [Pontibacillus litoralis JSM 072002]
MSFYEQCQHLQSHITEEMFREVTAADVQLVLAKDRITAEDYFTLLSPAAEPFLEQMAQKAHQYTVQHYGKTMQLFLPLYVSDYCVNTCKYCSFSIDHVFPRRKLTLEEIEKEAQMIAAKGIQDIILLSGESKLHSSVSYLQETMEVLRHYFSSVGIEIQPLDTNEYEQLVQSGIDSLTVYQEVYNEDVYRDIHVKGPKRHFKYRLDTPERGCQAGMRSVNIGALLGLDDWRKESFITGMHAHYLQNRYLETAISVSFPRIRPNAGSFQPKVEVADLHLVQAMVAFRLFMPRAGITMSTREHPTFRDQIIPLGVTKMSAESSTEVGGYAHPQETQSQFEISDDRSVQDIQRLLRQKGYQPIMKDWQITS